MISQREIDRINDIERRKREYLREVEPFSKIMIQLENSCCGYTINPLCIGIIDKKYPPGVPELIEECKRNIKLVQKLFLPEMESIE